jgi:endonuclease YncB( thermonuclease family)
MAIRSLSADKAEKREFGSVELMPQNLISRWGRNRKSHLQQLLSATSDRILLTPLERDQYGRVVAEVDTLETHKFVQYEMLLAGMAYVYDRYVDSCPNANFMHEAEAMAQQQRLGVWSGNYQKPWDYRRSQ